MKDRLLQMLGKTLSLGIAFILCFLLIRIFGWWSIAGRIGGASQTTLQVHGLVEDISVGIILLLLVGTFGELVALLSIRVAVVVEIILFFVLLITSFGVSQYFVVTLVPLGSDVFGYTPGDISVTVNSSVDGRAYIVQLILITVFFGGLIYLLINLTVTKPVAIAMALIVFALLPLRATPEDFENDLSYHIKMNKLWYLFGRSMEYWKEDSDPISFNKSDYPLLHPVNYADSLSQHFIKADIYPNLVFIVVEGLGRDFTGPRAPYGGFTPFLDSLSTQSLYWENAISNAGRTFGAVPSILGSLPYGKLGIMGYGNNMPDHQTLITLLSHYGYRSNFFYGGNPNFDNLDLFLERDDVNFFLNESNFPTGNKKDSWGYNDQLLFNAGLATTEKDNGNRLDIYQTLTTHEPFECPDSVFASKADKMIGNYTDQTKKEVMQANKNIFQCLLYTDGAIRSFMTSYSKRPDFGRTIFIITGDHRLIPILQDNKIKRFHVPILIYSPLLKKPATFPGIVAHSSILPSLLTLLHDQYELTFPRELPMISGPLSLGKDFSGDLHIPLIRNKNEINDFVSGTYFLSDDRLYSILPGLQLKVENNPAIKDQLKKDLREFQAKSLFAINNNRLDKTSDKNRSSFLLTAADEKYLADENISALDPDNKFSKAQVLSRAGDYLHSRIILKNILNKSPNYHDARNLLARTYSWQKNYDSAKLLLNQTLQRSPNYADTYAALADIDFWQGDLNQSLLDANNGLRSNPSDGELLSRKARALMAKNQKKEARKIVDSLVQSGFENEIVMQLKSMVK